MRSDSTKKKKGRISPFVSYLIGGALAPFFWFLILGLTLWAVRRFAPRLERPLFSDMFSGASKLGRVFGGLGVICFVLAFLYIAVYLAR